jgi:predicted short-subunit dehydrogenase-like oxidoreductase (DUF2520 family)
MKITIIGSGNVAFVLGRKLAMAGHSILEIVGRNTAHTEALAEMLGASPLLDPALMRKDADLYLLALSDAALEHASEFIQTNEAIVVHTAGSVSRKVLDACSLRNGVLYPLQSLRKGMEELPDIPLLIDASDPETQKTLEELARTLTGKVVIADDDTRLKLHVAAVLCSNFTNHLYTLTFDYCDKNGLDFYMLMPLMQETVNRLESYEPSAMQTGPAIRHDNHTLRTHEKMLSDFPEILDIYTYLSDHIQQYHSGEKPASRGE